MLNGETIVSAEAISTTRELVGTALQSNLHSSDAEVIEEYLLTEMIDNILRHVLIAGSRTVAGGDAYFVLEDLYGSDGLMFTPETHPIDPAKLTCTSRSQASSTVENTLDQIIRLRPNSPIAPSCSSDSLPDIDRRKRSVSNEIQSVLGRNCVSITVKKHTVLVVLTESYDLICRADIELSAREDVDVAPLISFDLSIKTVISLDALSRIAKSAAEEATAEAEGDESKGRTTEKKVIDTVREQLLGAGGDLICTRYVSIVPRLFACI
jgi:hypothetical protein